MNSIFQKRSCLTQREVKQYLTGKLSDNQRYDIENHLLDCELCSAALEGYAREEDFSSAEEGLQMLRAEVATAAQHLPPKRWLGWINRAAAVAAILVLAYAGYLYWNATRPAQLFADYYEPVANTYITYRSANAVDTPLPEELKQALKLYDAEDFELSLPHFTNYLKQNPEDQQALLLAASAHLQGGQGRQAEQYLLQLREEGTLLQGQVPWYLAMAYLQQKKKALARAQLEGILAEPASPFREKARRLLSEL